MFEGSLLRFVKDGLDVSSFLLKSAFCQARHLRSRFPETNRRHGAGLHCAGMRAAMRAVVDLSVQEKADIVAAKQKLHDQITEMVVCSSNNNMRLSF